jgi:pseudaminic acid synthase
VTSAPHAIEIAGRRIGAGAAPYLIAEMSANHGHQYDRALALVRAARAAGADAIKLQTYTPDTMTIDSDASPFVIRGTPWDGRRLHDLYREAFTPWEWHEGLMEEAHALGLHCFSTPFDATAVEYLERLNVPAYKIASFELVDIPLLRRIGHTGKPVILSTGMGTLEEIREAVSVLRQSGCRQLALLKCTSAYPAAPDEMNLLTLPALEREFDAPVGLSDHTLDVAVPVTAVALGACIVEKHFVLSRRDPGPDSAFSLEPDEFRVMAEAVRTAARALGAVHYGPTPREEGSLVFRRSLFVVRSVAAGESFTGDNVRCIRPGVGMHPRHLDDIIGRRAVRDIAAGTPLHWELVDVSAQV